VGVYQVVSVLVAAGLARPEHDTQVMSYEL